VRVFRLFLVLLLVAMMVPVAFADGKGDGKGRWFKVYGVITNIDYENRTFDLITRRGELAVQALEKTKIMIECEPARFAELTRGMKAHVMGVIKRKVLLAGKILVKGRTFHEVFKGIITDINHEKMGLILKK